jgi:hypothetical protein
MRGGSPRPMMVAALSAVAIVALIVGALWL